LRFYIEKTHFKKMAGGVAQGLGPEFKPQYHTHAHTHTHTHTQIPCYSSLRLLEEAEVTTGNGSEPGTLVLAFYFTLSLPGHMNWPNLNTVRHEVLSYYRENSKRLESIMDLTQ
jgi:hypothetical protein